MRISPTQRQTKYCTAIEMVLGNLGHASNARLLQELQKTYPRVTATTVHRATARLAQRQQIGIGPKSQDGSIQYDYNVAPHDHFICNECGLVKDADIKELVTPLIEQNIRDCRVSGRLTISGICKNCIAA